MNLSKPDRQLIIGAVIVAALVVLTVAGELDPETALMGIIGVAASMGVWHQMA